LVQSFHPILRFEAWVPTETERRPQSLIELHPSDWCTQYPIQASPTPAMRTHSISATPDRTILTHYPTGEALDKPLILTPEHPAALTFCVLGTLADPVVLASPRPHLFIYHGLLKCAREPDVRRWKDHCAEYETKVAHGKLTSELLQVFQEDAYAAHGFPRYRTISGRLWSPLRITRLGTFSVLTLWPNPRRQLTLPDLRHLGCLTRAKLPLLVTVDDLNKWIHPN
jgi:hypothetical protein